MRKILKLIASMNFRKKCKTRGYVIEVALYFDIELKFGIKFIMFLRTFSILSLIFKLKAQFKLMV